MRSQKYIVTKDEFHGYANSWLASALRLEYEGRKCTGNKVISVLLIAAARVVSIFAACRYNLRRSILPLARLQSQSQSQTVYSSAGDVGRSRCE